MSPLPRSPQTRRIDLAAWGVLLILAALFAGYGLFDRQSTLRQAGTEVEVVAEQTALAAENGIESGHQLLHAVSLLTSTHFSGAQIAQQLRNWKAESPYIMDLAILSKEGRILHWSGDGTPPEVHDREYFRHHHDHPASTLFIGKPALSRVHDGQWFFALSEALRDTEGQLTGVAVAIMNIATLRDQLTAPLSGGERSQTLAGLDGTIYARNPDHATHVGKRVSSDALPRDLAERIRDARHFIANSPLDGHTRIAAVRRLPKHPLLAAASVTVHDVLAPWRQRLMITTALWLAIALATRWVARRLKADLVLQETLANTDSLTGLNNRRAILDAAGTIERQQAGLDTLSLLMIDVDHFKRINDQHGHVAGDAVLREVAAVLRQLCRKTDLIGRYGGEEFLILLPDTPVAHALEVAEKLRKAVENLPATHGPVTISAGVAATGTHRSLQQTLILADQALYAAKAAGRNSVRAAET